ncbi:chemotaxis protein CheW [Rickettsiales bacterium]|nr:chemotaxis protein CheW [Rickettsiales bacterium]
MTNETGKQMQNNSELSSDHDSKQFLTFCVSDRTYGVELMSIREIKGWTATTELPNSPSFMKGVIDIRGVVIPIFDLRNRFEMGETNPNEKNVVIIIAVGEKLIGILVDAVSDIINANSDQIKEAPRVDHEAEGDFIDGIISIKEKMVIVLNVAKLFDAETLAQVEMEASKADIKIQNDDNKEAI